MRRDRGLGARRRFVLATTIGLIALVSGSSLAQSRPARRDAGTAAPLRALFYVTAPIRPARHAGQGPVPSAPSDDPGAVKRHLAALKWARADAAIVPWAMPGSGADRRLGRVLAAIASARAHVRVVALIDRPAGNEALEMDALAHSRARARSYLRIASNPAVVIAPADRSLRTCARALRWRAAALRFWLVQAAFPGYGRCRAAADAWFGDAANARSSRVGTTFLIRPGLWPAGAGAPTLPRSLATWQRAIARMNASPARLQIIDSLNDWARGSAIEPSAQWPSASGFGTYLDALHGQPPGVPLPPVPPAIEAVSITALSAHQVSLTATISGGRTGAALWVEFGSTIAYGQTTAPLSLDDASPRQTVTVVIPSLTAATGYHARVSLTSPAGSFMGADVPFATPSDPSSVRLAAAGDIACDPASSEFNGGAGTPTECHQMGVSNAILAGAYDAVLPLGDEQYNSGTASAFAASYDPSWGRLKAVSHPTVGNHEYSTPGAAPYFQYFGATAGEPGNGYYSYELGSWHVVVINSNCAQIGGCSPGSPQELWLRSDLAAHPARCTLAYWHHPRFSSGQAGDAESLQTIWTDLFAAGAELVLNGHDHDYERFAPQNADGKLDDGHGIREFVVGTGGKNHMNFKTIEANSVVHDTSSFGFLELTLSEGIYSWRFVSDPPGGFSDSGSGTCH
ncbi:MAG TPA: metallophosphoesterase [Gaiellales bacterium]|nr:metallophosphoesterase [Gaiellales bacterium]